MTQLLGGIHDREGAHLVPPGGWVLDTVEVGTNPNAPGTDYGKLGPGRNFIARLNHGYGSTGTIPLPDQYESFGAACAAYVARSSGCTRWIIGNEPNLPREWPSGQRILPLHYAECYLECRDAIHGVPGHERDEVLVAAPGPWNNELKYPDNELGDWIAYFEDVQDILGRQCDGFSFHAYTHGYDPALVTSDARMGAPFVHRHYEFRTYRDYAEAVRPELRHLPIYLTEANGNGPWQAVGLMPAMLEEISAWNASGKQGIHCVIFYRYPRYDEFYIDGKGDVIAEFQAAMQREYVLPKASTATTPGSQQFMPAISTGPTIPVPVPPAPPREIDPRATARGVTIQTPAGQPVTWSVSKIEWLDEQQAGGRHHIFADVLDEQSKRVVNVPLLVKWPTGDHVIITEAKPGERYAANFPMSPSRNEFSITVAGDAASETVAGIGMGADTPGGFNAGIHTSTFVVFRRGSVAQPPPPKETPVTIPTLLHPIADPALRVISQRFGANDEDYARFNLKGHAGIDFAVKVGTPIGATDGGVVQESGTLPDYGEYIKLQHPWGESVYAHLKTRHVEAGEPVNRGTVIGLSGNTGNSTGPHLHFAIRIYPYTRGFPYDGFTDPAPFLPNAGTQPPYQPTGQPTRAELIAITKAAAEEFAVDWRLLAALIQAESSYNPNSRNVNTGAAGLGNFMPATWTEWSALVGAKDIYNATDNARTTAAYLAWCIKTAGGRREGLWSYNWGVGRVLDGLEPPAETIEYASKILFGVDLLAVVGVDA